MRLTHDSHLQKFINMIQVRFSRLQSVRAFGGSKRGEGAGRQPFLLLWTKTFPPFTHFPRIHPTRPCSVIVAHEQF